VISREVRPSCLIEVAAGKKPPEPSVKRRLGRKPGQADAAASHSDLSDAGLPGLPTLFPFPIFGKICFCDFRPSL
jgi:hypothetical protein